ncbi:MAG TPA: dipeptidase PepE [Gammaproteobacteria bacterium]
MNLLLLSSSRAADTGFLEVNADSIVESLQGVRRALFIPYAVVGSQRNARLDFVHARFAELGFDILNIDDAPDPAAALRNAEAVLVSGGNTFCLLKALYDNGLVDSLRACVRAGVPYIGWSAGSNVAGKSIRTTNDMPIVYPPAFEALALVPFQLNPHYTDAMPEGLRGETREQRIEEFLMENPAEFVVGLPEGDGLRVTGDRMRLVGAHDAWLFRSGQPRQRLEAGRDLSHLL